MFMEVDISGLKLSDYEENLSKKQKSKIFEDNIKRSMTKILESEKFKNTLIKLKNILLSKRIREYKSG